MSPNFLHLRWLPQSLGVALDYCFHSLPLCQALLNENLYFISEQCEIWSLVRQEHWTVSHFQFLIRRVFTSSLQEMAHYFLSKTHDHRINFQLHQYIHRNPFLGLVSLLLSVVGLVVQVQRKVLNFLHHVFLPSNLESYLNHLRHLFSSYGLKAYHQALIKLAYYPSQDPIHQPPQVLQVLFLIHQLHPSQMKVDYFWMPQRHQSQICHEKFAPD